MVQSPQGNRAAVRDYYDRNKDIVAFRKVMKRCRDMGSVPSFKTVETHDIPVQALMVAFGEWAASSANEKQVKKQQQKLQRLRLTAAKLQPNAYAEPTANEKAALLYLRRFNEKPS